MVDFLFPEVKELSGILLMVALPALALGVFFLVWRAHMAMNHPEKYRRFREWEEEETARQKKILGGAAQVGGKILGRILKR